MKKNEYLKLQQEVARYNQAYEDGEPLISDYDYDDLFEKRNGVYINAYVIIPFTKTSHFVFGVSWLNDCNSENDHQTWFGADPTIMNKSDAIEGNASPRKPKKLISNRSFVGSLLVACL